MKKHLLTLTALLLLATQAFAWDFSLQNNDGVSIYYNIISDTTVEVTFDENHSYYSGIVNIPNEVTNDGYTYTVTSIGFNAFFECIDLTAVTLPVGITTIGEYAFAYCENFTSIIIPDAVTLIGSFAFYRSGLTSVAIPDGVTSIENNVFDGCGNLVSVEMPNSLTTIGDGAFKACWYLPSIIIPNNVLSIGMYAFYECNSLQTATIPDGVTSIGLGAFSKCSELQSMNIPASLSSLENEIFSYCNSLISVTIHENISFIGENVFLGCSNLISIDVNIDNQYYSSIDGALFDKDQTEIIKYPEGKTNDNYVIPDGITSIENYAFCLADNLISIAIPETVIAIGDYAFANCRKLTELNILDGVTSIGKYAFFRCSSLSSMSIPDGITSIEESIFADCSGLTSVSLSNSVISIGQRAFENCTALDSITCLALTPPTIDANHGADISTLIVVPCMSLDTYRTAPVWSDFTDFECVDVLRFAPVGAEWYFNYVWSGYSMEPDDSYYHIECLGDTIIGGHLARIISRPVDYEDNQYVYEENGVVYWYNYFTESYSVLYDFNAEAGDGWTIAVDSCEFNVSVTSVESINYNGQTYAVQNVESDSEFGFYGRIINGIGYENGLFPLKESCGFEVFDNYYIDYMRCYLVDGELLYKQGPYDCDEIAGSSTIDYWDGSIAESFAGGTGTENDPYIIANGEQLAFLAKMTNENNENYNSAYYRQVDDIYLNRNYEAYAEWGENPPDNEWTPIGNINSDGFKGSYDGDYHGIMGVYNNDGELNGLFGTARGIIRDLNVSYSYVDGSGLIAGEAINSDIYFCSVRSSSVVKSSSGTAGGIVGKFISNNNETHYITNCLNSGHVKGNIAGGIVGEVESSDSTGMVEIRKCTNHGLIEAGGDFGEAGGICGDMSSGIKISECVNNADINADISGGIVGVGGGVIESCQNHGRMTYDNEYHNWDGGIIGWGSMVDIINCENDASFQGGGIAYACSSSNLYNCRNYASDSIMGGIVYEYRILESNGNFEIVGCVNYGNLNVMSYPIGGIVVNIHDCINGGNDTLVIKNCINNGSLSSKYTVGGIAGLSYNAVFEQCENNGDIDTQQSAGGICGYAQHTEISNCINKKQVSSSYSGGICGNMEYSIIYNCVNVGDITGKIIGGIAGRTFISTILNSYSNGNFYGEEWVGGIAGDATTSNTILNVYNGSAFENIPILNQNVYGITRDGEYSNDHNCYWKARTGLDGFDYSYVYSFNFCANSSSFHQGDTPTSWILDTIQYETDDLLAALNSGIPALNRDYPNLVFKSWREDELMNNNGLPVLSEEPPFSPVGAEWYYEILGGNGVVTYQHLMYASDTTVNHKDVKVIIRTNTLYDKKHTTTTREYIYEENDTVYWYNTTLDIFTMLYDFSAEEGDEWQIFVEDKVITMHVDGTEMYEYEGVNYKVLHVSDNENLFSGDIVRNIGHLTSFFPESLMSTRNDFRANGMRCFWINGKLVFKMGNSDCDAIYQTFIGLEEQTTENLRIYPNPAKDVLYIESDEIMNCNYFIYNMMGQIEKQGILNENEINISELKNGLYLLDCNGVTLRFVKIEK